MNRREEFIGVRTIEAANVYGEGQHLYNMWLTDEPIVRCRDCELLVDHGEVVQHSRYTCGDAGIVTLDGFCAWGKKR